MAQDAAPLPSQPPVRVCPACGGQFPVDFRVCPKDATPLTDESQDDPLLNVVVAGAYRIIRVVTAGGMGRLYEAEHVRLFQPMAVKVLHEAHAHRKEAVARFHREARVISKIRSQHVLRIIDVLPAPDGRPCIVTDFLEGEDLSQRLEREGTLPIHEAISLGRQLCTGVAAAHASSVIHRDLKPSNVFLAKDDLGNETLKVLDFGVAKLLIDSDPLTQTGALIGTPAYMAPEQAAGDPDVDHRADVYAVGAVLYHMLAGQPPYGNQDATGTLMGLLKGAPPRARSVNKAIPEGLEALLERAMAREPDERPQSILELRDALEPFGAVADAARGERQSSTVHNAGRRARWTRVIAGTLAAVVGLLAAAWLMAFLGVLFSALLPSEPTILVRVILIGAPAAVGTAVMALAARALYYRWRSGPMVERLIRTLVATARTGLITFAVLELGVSAARAIDALAGPVSRVEHTMALGIAMCAALSRFLWERRRP